MNHIALNRTIAHRIAGRALFGGLLGALVVAGSPGLEALGAGRDRAERGIQSEPFRTIEWVQVGVIYSQGVWLIASPEEWNALVNRLELAGLPAPEPPDIDWRRKVVLIAARGRQNTTGYNVEILELLRHGEVLTAKVKFSSPGPGDFVIQMITAPCQIVEVDCRNITSFNVELCD